MSRILIVDDEYYSVYALQINTDWKKMGIDEVLAATNVADAQRILRNVQVEVLLTDIEMPGKSGVELLKWTRENSPLTQTIFLSCHAEFSYAQDAIKLGINDYLLKPVEEKELSQAVASALKRYREVQIGSKIIETSGLMSLNGKKTIIEEACRYIVEHLGGECRRNQIAEAVHVSPDYLSRIFKNETGVGLTEYIVMQRIQLAKSLLSKTTDSISSIAEKTGFRYEAYFSKIFRDKTGLSPLAYRNQYREN